MSRPDRRLVIVVRADPVICGHSGEARNLAEAALTRGFDDVRILSWPIPALEAAGLPLKPADSVLPYSEGITVERPQPVGDYRLPDGRYLGGLTGRLFELFTDGVPTTALSMYLSPHNDAVIAASRAAAAALPEAARHVTTMAKAVGSDITNVVRTCLERGELGAAAVLFSTYLANDRCLAVSEYTRDLILACAVEVDAKCGTTFAEQCERRVEISYPPIDADAFLDPAPAGVQAALAARGLTRGGYVLFLSRVAKAKGLDDLLAAWQRCRAREAVRLVIAGTGPDLPEVRAAAAGDATVSFLTDVGDEEKPLLMNGSAAFALPSKPRPEFVETFGIALAEAMLAGGGPVITTTTGGIGEAVGDTAIEVAAADPAGLAAALDRAVLETSPADREMLAARARAHALQFDRGRVFDDLLAG